ncbi:uncharacterized protein BDR25DRAFT_235383 [Lindgomyces ingoldianus]|uniref:Uncharacterized protein n=1 Tax=Lindgomyces ingoldianus TaxID=673940 RepID=A0ACB6QMC8_9PLEO|nr:uncharacterized protein BDR25DRAFT_235383 [Lindgomyces ingoldianus]KAF2467270.1 hypothetical protein BDR25DRAFT_235383 [Lindgomyces ingoldianus]
MRRNTYPLRPKAEDHLRAPELPSRKVFSCIVDDTALIAGVKKSTRDGIRKWVSHDAIRLYVPLHTLAQLDRLKKGSERINADARDAIKWLDDITSMPAGHVQLEGAEEIFPTWDEVESFLLPETLLSMEDTESDEDDYPEDLESSFNPLDASDETSMSSTHSLDDRPKTPQSPESFATGDSKLENRSPYNPKASALVLESPDRTARNSTELARSQKSPKSTVPAYLQPLFNHILWRIHNEKNPNAALESFILLTNDPTKQMIAQRFGIRAKRLEQLRDAVGREDREYKNRLTLYKIESEAAKPQAPIEETTTEHNTIAERPKSSHSRVADPNSDDEDVVLFKRAPRGPQAQNINGQRVFDPNEFGRVNQHAGGRGGRGGQGGPRGRGGPRGGRGGFAPRGAYVPPGPTFRAPPAPRIVDPNQPIDPDSFSRPTLRASNVRGTRRKLWEPN